MEKEIIFKIVSTNDLEVDMTLSEMRSFPTHSMRFHEHFERLIRVEYHPTKNFDKDQFKAFMIKKLKKRFKAFSVEAFEPVNKLGE